MDSKQKLMKYQAADAEVVDYKYGDLESCSFAVRGPVSFSSGKRKVVCLGSAATFGRFVQEPFAQLIAKRCDVEVLNLGFGGARFETYLKEPATLTLCRQADLIVLETMSARSYPSKMFKAMNHLTGHGKLTQEYKKLLKEAYSNSVLLRRNRLFVDQVYKWAAKNLDWQELSEIRAQILQGYVQDAIKLIETIGRPVVLLYFSQRSIDLRSTFGTYATWSGGFPHFVDVSTFNSISSSAIGTISVVSRKGIPSPLISRSTGCPVAILKGSKTPDFNTYYPSPEMHMEVAEKLISFIRNLGI